MSKSQGSELPNSPLPVVRNGNKHTACTGHAPQLLPTTTGGPFNPLQVALNVSGPGMSHPPLGGEAFDAATANVTRWVVAEALKAATGERTRPLRHFIPAAAQHTQHVLSMPVHCTELRCSDHKTVIRVQRDTTHTLAWTLAPPPHPNPTPTPTLSFSPCPCHRVLPHSQGKERHGDVHHQHPREAGD